MALPFFYISEFETAQKELTLDEETSKHIVQVLRMKKGEQLNLTDGKGNLIMALITDDHKKHCIVELKETRHKAQGTRRVSVAISLLKNTNRFEWFLEKATEIGVSEIIPLICERTEKEKFRYDRMQGICISAILQSQQVWLPLLHEPQALDRALKNKDGCRMIAHCTEKERQTIPQLIKKYPHDHYSILIGPEGDFTGEEIEYAKTMQCFEITLGETRLRTETAGIVAATLLCHI
jgi:16S rRNA (uracil1498-N3)-methyltransferase